MTADDPVAAKAEMEPVLARTRFSKPIYQEAARKLVETGGGALSHPVGLAVHDDGPYHPAPLRPGTCSPWTPSSGCPRRSCTTGTRTWW